MSGKHPGSDALGTALSRAAATAYALNGAKLRADWRVNAYATFIRCDLNKAAEMADAGDEYRLIHLKSAARNADHLIAACIGGR